MPECIYCGSTWYPEEDHVRARLTGGVSTVGACRTCNRSKGAKQLMQWLRWLKRNDPYRWRRIVDYNYGRRNEIAQKVHIVRDEG